LLSAQSRIDLRGYRVEERIDYIVEELAAAQDAHGNGYVGGIPGQEALWKEIESGTVEGEPFYLNDVWVPWYTLHKLYAGLIDAYAYTGNETALHVVTDLADWAIDVTDGLSPAQWQEMLDTEHGGMNESLANLYALTGEQRYLTLSRKFHHGDVLTPLAQDTARLGGLHGNTQIPKVIGAARQYELTGADSLRTIADAFWERVVNHHTYVIGGHSEGEHFGPRDSLSTRLGTTTAETCNTYNMLKLTRHLFSLSAAPRYADYYERALYNHILASQEPKRGMTTYFMSLEPGHFKTYATPDSSFWCCTGSGMENHVRYGQGIYFQKDDNLFVNLFIPSALSWEEQGVTVRQHTRFPEENTTRLTFEMDEPTELGLRLRNPGWTDGPPTVRVNGERVEPEMMNGFLSHRRTWQPSDTVEVTLPMSLRTERMPDDPDRVAVLYGPIVLAGTLGTEGLPEGGAYAKDHLTYTGADLFIPDSLRTAEHPYTLNPPPVPSLQAEADRVAEWLTPVEGEPLSFQTRSVGLEENLTFRPFYDVHHQRYSVYWTLTDAAGAD
ncbi:MAG: beta-L-arabinofuranosidase domain-containing protein, partial [Salinivenus sp.]